MPYLGVKPAAEFTSKDLNGAELILDADADTTITADTDDQIDVRIAGADDFQFTANTFTAQSGSTIAAQALTATTIGSSAGVTITGTTPTLTIGDAGAEDTAIIFDGNAQDFHVGLDDTADELVMGLGSALGTTTHMAFDAAGIIRKPLQSSFRAFAGGSTTFTDNTYIKVGMTSETYDTNADYTTASSRFTAPVDGRYLFTANLQGLDNFGTTDNTQIIMVFYVNNSATDLIDRMKLDSDDDMAQYYDTYGMGGSAIIKLDATDYVEVFVYQNSGGDAAMNYTSPYVYWSGELLG
jgi:hypothetical protein